MDIRLVRSVRTHGASLGPRAFELAERFISRVSAHPSTKTKLFGRRTPGTRECAIRWAWFVRNLGRLDQAGPELAVLRRGLANRGISSADLQFLQGCLLAATAEVSGPNWNHQLEADWLAAMEDVVVRFSDEAVRPMRMAA